MEDLSTASRQPAVQPHASMERRDRAMQHLTLPRAAALAYFEITGRSIDAARAPQMREVLCDIAHALSILAPIHLMEGSPAMARELPPSALLGATFERGADVLRLRDGTQLRELTIQRKDLAEAIELLKHAGFGPRWISGS
jgi:hypothetical protein